MSTNLQNQPQWPNLDDAFAQVQAYATRLSTVFHQQFHTELFHVEDHSEIAPTIVIKSDCGWNIKIVVTDAGYLIRYESEELGQVESTSLEALLNPGKSSVLMVHGGLRDCKRLSGGNRARTIQRR